MAEETVLIRFKSEDDASKTTKAVGDGLDDVGKKAGNAGKSFSSMQSVMSGVLQGIGQGLVGLAANLGSKALGAVTDFVGGAIEEASSWNSVMAQTEAVIASTGGAAGLTAKEMADMASEMSAASGQSLFSDDAILGAQNVLATFTNIKGENFGSATKSILDMSQALGMDLDSAAMQVGKALNDPVAGIAALSRSGVQFTADQEAMIKAMVEAGDTAGAQELMMKELNTQFGGSASAAVDTYAGQQIVLQEQFAGIQQTLGEALMPILMEFGKFMSDTVVPIIASVVTSLANWITSMQQTGTTSAIFTTIKDAIAAVPSVLEQLGLGLERVKTFLTPLTEQ
jgi:phage-related minor tail protein